MNIKPLFDRVVLKVETKEKTQSGIVLPSSDNKSQLAKVVAVGDGMPAEGKKVEMQVKVGDTVVFSKYAGTEVESDGEKLLLVSQSDILAIVK